MDKSKENDTNQEKKKLIYYKALHDIAGQIHSAKDINQILINLKDQILSLF